MSDENEQDPPGVPSGRKERKPYPKNRKPPEFVPAHKSLHRQYLPGERLAKRAVDVDLEFKRALQMCSWFMDRMEHEINNSDGFAGVPSGFNTYMRDLASAMNTLSLSHARWLKANEEMYERLSDDEKLAALQDWMVALYLKHPPIVSDWIRGVVSKCKLAVKSTEKPRTSTGDQEGAVADFIGGKVGNDGQIGTPGRPSWKDVANKVRADFKAKKEKAFNRAAIEAESKRLTGLGPAPAPTPRSEPIIRANPEAEPNGSGEPESN